MELADLEALAFHSDRNVALSALLPGTIESDYWRAIFFQHAGRLDEVDAILTDFTKRHGRGNPMYERLRRRQLLLRASTNLPATVDALRRELNITLDDRAEVVVKTERFPTKLDPAVIDGAKLLVSEAQTHPDLSTISDYGLVDLAGGMSSEGDLTRLRHFLSRITRANLPGLVKLIATDLSVRSSGGFGSLGIHALLTLAQLEELASLRPELRSVTAWVDAVLLRQRPATFFDLRIDVDERIAFLDRLWAFVSTLAPTFNTLKAQVLFRRLELDRSRNVYDRTRFLAYLELPRNVHYVPREWATKVPAEHLVQPNTFAGRAAGLEPIGDDEPLVRDYLSRFLLEEDGSAFIHFLRAEWVEEVLATTRLLVGIGGAEAERWAKVLGPARLAALRDRVDIELAPQNQILFGEHDRVALDVDVKNVRELEVKVFRINALSYFLAKGTEVDTSLDLDGMIASGDERKILLDHLPIRRTRQHLDLPLCDRPGTYIVELIGNGRSSRALIRKGSLRHSVRIGSAGAVVTIMNDSGEPLPHARLWIGGREMGPRTDRNEPGSITIPFSTRPSRVPILLVHGDVTQREYLDHPSEGVALESGFHLERESFVPNQTARILLRPKLSIGGVPASVTLLEAPVVEINMADGDGTSSSKTQSVVLKDDACTVVETLVPEGTQYVNATLRGKVRVMSTQTTLDLDAGTQADVNQIHASEMVIAMHLAKVASTASQPGKTDHLLYLLGKTGEPIVGRPVTFLFLHRNIKRSVETTLETNAEGAIELGLLDGIVSFDAISSGQRKEFSLPLAVFPPRILHAVQGSKVFLPSEIGTQLADLCLVELRGGVSFRDVTAAACTLTDGGRCLEIQNLLAGEYRLSTRGRADTEIVVAAARISSRPGWAIAGRAMYELTPELPIIRSFTRDQTHAILKVSGASPFTCVHLIATRFRAESVFTTSTINRASPTPLSARSAPAFSLYISGRDIGDEYRYVLERRTAQKRPGTMLEKPSLLLNPWALRTTSTSIQEATAGSAYGTAAPPPPMQAAPAPMMAAPAMSYGGAVAMGARGSFAGPSADRAKKAKRDSAPSTVRIEPGFESYEFLPKGATVIENLRVDADGFVRVPLESLAFGDQAQIVKALVIDPSFSMSAELPLPPLPTAKSRDLRLRLALDPTRHYAQERSVVAVLKDNTIVIEDVRTGKVELVDTIGRAHQILLTLNDNSDLRELSFVKDWHKLDEATRRTRYSKYACHELNVFLWKKDEAFTKNVVLPYLAHKRDKTFIDHFLLGSDLSGYLEPWRFGRLNTVERILLGVRIAEVKDAVARLLGDAVDVQRWDPERDARLVSTLLGSGALEASEVGAAARAHTGGVDFLMEADDDEAPDTNRPMQALEKAAAPKPRPSKMAKEESSRSYVMAEIDTRSMATGGGGYGAGGMLADAAERMQNEALFRGADKTKEWAETSWWKMRIESIDATLITPNRFWRDLARHLMNGATATTPFLSPHLGDCASSFAEAMCALAFLELPFVAGKHETKLEDMSLTVTPKSHVLAAQSRIAEIQAPETATSGGVLIGQNYLLAADRWSWDGAEQREKYVTGEMLIGTVYRCQVVITNPTSAREKLDLLLQVPRGALPVATDTTRNGFITKTVNLELEPYGTQSVEYAFYFPRPGKFTHFPAHVAKGLVHITSAEPRELDVVKEPTVVDSTSWAHISQQGTLDEVLAFIDGANLERIDLGRIAWRMHDRNAFERITSRLSARRVYDDNLWRYALAHHDRKRLSEWLDHQAAFLRQAGPVLDRTQALSGIDSIERGWYQHLEYAPLINARAHQLGARRRILNDALSEQYRSFLDLVAHRPRVTNEDLLAAAHYVLAMDRIDDALSILARVQPDGLEARVQYDYLAAYCACYRGDLTSARSFIANWREHPVDRWRNRFAALTQMLDEVATTPRTVETPALKTQIIDPDNREQKMAESAARQPSLEISISGSDIVILHHNVAASELRFFRMDIELLFSRQPFVQGDVERFSFIEPGVVLNVTHVEGGKTVVPLPPALLGSNLVIEAVAPSLRKSVAHYAHDLGVHVAQGFGQLHVVRASTQEALSATYVKVYGRYRDKTVHFFKDGYTDLRGRFDYATLSTDDLDRVERLALLVVSDQAGATIVETTPPPQ